MARSFYCNHCGKKVARDALRCPSCGRYFGAVLCPRCGYSGGEGEFVSGCPSCGYLGDRTDRDGSSPSGKKKERPLLDLPPAFFVVGIVLLSGLLIFLIKLWF